MWYWGPGASGWAVLADILLNAAFWGLLIWAFVAMLGGARRGRGGSSWYGGYGAYRPEADPERTLALRFATGEIDADEYYRRLAVLRQHCSADGASADGAAADVAGRRPRPGEPGAAMA